MRLAGLLVISLFLVSALSGDVLGATPADIKAAADLGILHEGSVVLPPDMPVSRSLWAAMLHEALGIWLPAGLRPAECRDAARDRDGEICAVLVSAGWMKLPGPRTFLPFRWLSAQDAIQSLRAVMGTIAHKTGAEGTIPCRKWELQMAAMLDCSPLREDGSPLALAQAAALLCKAVQVIPVPGLVDPPEATVRSYFGNLFWAIESGCLRPPVLPVSGAAAAALARNVLMLRTLSGGQLPSFHLVDMDVMAVDTSGLIAVVTVRRRMKSGFPGSTQENSAVDLFRLRLGPAGWLIFR